MLLVHGTQKLDTYYTKCKNNKTATVKFGKEQQRQIPGNLQGLMRRTSFPN